MNPASSRPIASQLRTIAVDALVAVTLFAAVLATMRAGAFAPEPPVLPSGGPIVGRGLIAYSAYADGNSEIFVIDLACLERPGGCTPQDAVNITRNRAHDFGPAWSPDGRRIAFISDRSGRQRLYVIDAACLAPEAGCAILPTALVSNAESFPADELEGEYFPYLSWSRDGRQLAASFVLHPRPGPELAFTGPFLFLVRTDGTGSVQTRWGSKKPALWSPGGDLLAFIASPRRTAGPDTDKVHIAYSGDSNPHQLTEARGLAAEWPDVVAWSPDGRQLAYLHVTYYHDPVRRTETGLTLLEMPGGQPTPLFAREVMTMAYGGWSVNSPNHVLDWAPDGRRLLLDIYFFRVDRIIRQLFVINRDGSELAALEAYPRGPYVHGDIACWTRDSESVVYIAGDESSAALMLIDLAGGPPGDARPEQIIPIAPSSRTTAFSSIACQP